MQNQWCVANSYCQVLSIDLKWFNFLNPQRQQVHSFFRGMKWSKNVKKKQHFFSPVKHRPISHPRHKQIDSIPHPLITNAYRYGVPVGVSVVCGYTYITSSNTKLKCLTLVKTLHKMEFQSRYIWYLEYSLCLISEDDIITSVCWWSGTWTHNLHIIMFRAFLVAIYTAAQLINKHCIICPW